MKITSDFLMENIHNIKFIKKGDTVIWKQKPSDIGEKVQIREITLQYEKGASTDGWDLDSANWADRDRLVFNLSNGKWAYGEQIYLIDGEK